MSDGNLAKALTGLIEDALGAVGPPGLRLRSTGARPGRAPTYEEIAEDLAQQAVASGNPLVNRDIQAQRLDGGNTAELVAILTLRAPFILKFDSADAKLAREGLFMRDVRVSLVYPERFRAAWPVVYAVRDEAPYAYLMEYFPADEGWRSLEDRLYPRPDGAALTAAQAQRLMDATLDILFSGYGARQEKRLIPSVDADYVSRIRERLVAAAARDPRFASRSLSVNGEALEPWEGYLRQLGANSAYLAKISPRFATVAHGDPNPGNVMLRTGPSSIDVKLIDPKDWREGDYLFDIAKITHFLEGTGPIEKPPSGTATTVAYVEHGPSAEIRYTIEHPNWTRGLVDACLERVEAFALEHGDPHWAARYELGMAANLLGLPEGRLKSGRADAALALYGEGLLWLRRFCARLQQTRAAPPTLALAEKNEVEPAELARVRAHVRAHVPDVREHLDARGFQQLQWDPVRPNSRGKPNELSLEHEARLMPTSQRGIELLQVVLERAAAETVPVGRSLLPGPSTFADLIVSRYPREPGAQSVDHYWEVQDVSPELRLIGRMLSLRERIATRDFMTWAGAGEGPRPLNFELPIVALGTSGVISRLEFNWMDDLSDALNELHTAADGERTANPLVLASQFFPLDPARYAPVIEHTTFREKYAISTAGSDGPAEQLLQFNIDHVVAQSLRTRRIASYTDIDIAPSRKVDTETLATLITFTEAISHRFELVPIAASKVWRDASVLGELD